MIISGTGVHHNDGTDPLGLEEDADKRLIEFAAQLCADGHVLRSAAFVTGEMSDTVGGFEWIKNGGYRFTEIHRADGRIQDAGTIVVERAIRRFPPTSTGGCTCGGNCGCGGDTVANSP